MWIAYRAKGLQDWLAHTHSLLKFSIMISHNDDNNVFEVAVVL